MKMIALALTLTGLCAWSQSLDLTSLDKLAAKAKEVNKVSLDRSQLQMALKMASKGDGDTKQLMSGLEGVQVREYTFEQKGQYLESDVDAVRAQVEKMRGCMAIVDSKEKSEHSQVFICSADGKPSGLAVISTEPKEVTVVFVRGTVNFGDLGKLGGGMGLPRVEVDVDKK